MFLGKHLQVLLDRAMNGSIGAFGVVVRVWNYDMVNLVIFPDGAPFHATSVRVVKTLDDALEERNAGYSGPIAYHHSPDNP